MKKYFWVFLSIIGSIGLADDHIFNTGFIIDNHEVAQSLSKETQMPLLTIYSADFCGYCQKLKKDIVELDTLDRFIVCIVDVEKNKELQTQMKVKNLPTSIITINNKEVSRKIGYNKKEYKDWLNSLSKTSR